MIFKSYGTRSTRRRECLVSVLVACSLVPLDFYQDETGYGFWQCPRVYLLSIYFCMDAVSADDPSIVL